jgi:hypothetical protein
VCDVYASSKESSVLKVRPAAKRCVAESGGSGRLRPCLTRAGPQPGLETIEGYLRTYGEPLAARVSEKAPLMLASCDSKVRTPYARRTCLLFAQDQRGPGARWARPPHGTQQAALRRPGVRRGGARRARDAPKSVLL